MNLSILSAFISDQRKAKEIVSKHFDVPIDMKAVDWAHDYSRIKKIYDKNPFADIFYVHGFGVELKIGDFYVDYDYSVNGYEDGFDAWKIFVYITAGNYDCNGKDGAISDRVHAWYNYLMKSGKTKLIDNLCYLVK